MSDKVAWCEIENAEYTADLDLWVGLCSPGPHRGSPVPRFKTVLELGAGVGRVSLRLRALGADVWALDNERELLDEIVRRAQALGIGEIFPICADARSYASLGRRFDLVIAPQVFLQLFETRVERVAIMERAAHHLASQGGSSFWMTFQPDLEQAWADDGDAPVPPQVMEVDGRTFETQPLESYWHRHDGERSLRIIWSRWVDGEESTAERHYADLTQAGIEDEASEAGLELVDAIALPGDNGFLDQLALRFIAATSARAAPTLDRSRAQALVRVSSSP
jgi:SAM-dependent methyltransferase